MTSIIVALDVPTPAEAFALVETLGDQVDYYKIGSPLYTRVGPDIVREIKARGKRVFLDLKYHDIPSTVGNAVEAAATLDVDMLTLHASGGEAMLKAAVQAAGTGGPRLLGVTILTSFTADDVENVWDKKVLSVRDEVVRLATLAADAGLHGIVSSALEAETLKRRHGHAFIVVTPGIRPAGGKAGDQARTATPGEATRAGADFLVIGRPITEAADPRAVAEMVRAEIAGVEEIPA
jgi:orotidine-5'-phosphate decarboxylase